MLKIFLLISALWVLPWLQTCPTNFDISNKNGPCPGGGLGGASNLYNIINIHSEKNVGWILHEDNGPNHPMIHLNVKCGYIL